MHFKEFDWLSGHGIMSHYTMPFGYGEHTREFLGMLLLFFQGSFPRF